MPVIGTNHYDVPNFQSANQSVKQSSNNLQVNGFEVLVAYRVLMGIAFFGNLDQHRTCARSCSFDAIERLTMPVFDCLS